MVDELLPKNMTFELHTHKVFDYEVQKNWLSNKFCKQIIKDINHARVVMGGTKDLETGEFYSITNLSGGVKCLIVNYMNDNPNRVFMTYMGDNCCDFMEQIAAKFEKQGRDLWIVSDYLHDFKFKYIKEIYYVNWNEACRSISDIEHKIADKYFEQNSKLYKMGSYREEDKDEWEED